MAETTNVKELVLNVLTEEQYNEATKQDNELYLIKNMDNSEVFVATYESTTFEEITDAINKEKICICQRNIDEKIQYGQLVIIEDTAYYFEASSDTEVISKDFLKITSDNIWTSQNVEVKINSTTEISSSSTNEEFPTAAASYNFVNNNYLNKSNPTGTGSLSLNRKANTTIGNYSIAIGNSNTASGNYSHAEGNGTTASGADSHAEGNGTTASGADSHAEGSSTKATADNSHAEGLSSEATAMYAHAEGYVSYAKGEASHAEGYWTDASGNYGSHAEGYLAKAQNNAAHAEGNSTTASGYASHAEGYYTKATNDTTLSGSSSSLSEYQGYYTHAEGYRTVASGAAAHSEGNGSTASGNYSHAEGYGSTVSGVSGHAEGWGTTASGDVAHAEGFQTTASGHYSHAEGQLTTASGIYSHAAGYKTTALDNQYVIGHYNNTSTGTAATSEGSGTSSSTSQSLFVVGNGTSSSNTNAFRVNQYGKAYCKTTYSSSGADYAEFFEWEDSNSNNEDRRGYFVTLNGKKIKIAKPGDYILGVVSAMPAVIGNGDEDWMNRYITDEFGAFVYEEFEYKEEIMENDNISTIVKTGLKHKENPNYDPTIPYIPREDRPEWDTIGMMGVLAVRDDGSCLVNEYCQVAESGIASYAINGYRVIERVNDHVVKIIFK